MGLAVRVSSPEAVEIDIKFERIFAIAGHDDTEYRKKMEIANC